MTQANGDGRPPFRIVREHLETYLAQAEEGDPMGDGVPTHVENEVRSYLRCGILAHGFARARCSGCGHEFLVGFSCRQRGSCPSCSARHMAETAAHMVDHVFPHVPVRPDNSTSKRSGSQRMGTPPT